ncbi:Hypothetical protein ACI5QL_01502 [Bacillus velezensis]
MSKSQWDIRKKHFFIKSSWPVGPNTFTFSVSSRYIQYNTECG